MAEYVILASGSGTNFEAIATALADSPHRLTALITDRPDIGALEKARSLGVPVRVIHYADGRNEAEILLLNVLDELRPGLICLAGFMKILPSAIVAAYRGKIINIHPSLLPAYPGTHAIERSYESGDTELGVSIHYVDEGVDTGQVVAQERIQRNGLRSVSEAETAIHAVEHRLYPLIARQLLDESEADIQESGDTTQ